MMTRKVIGYNVYRAADGCGEEFYGFVKTIEEARALVDGKALPESLYATADAAGHCGGVRSPDKRNEGAAVEWFGEDGYDCAVEVFMGEYSLNLRDEQNATHSIDIEAKDSDEAINAAKEMVQSEADDWCSDGEWGSDGASINVRWDLTDSDDNEIASGSVVVDIEPDHSEKIKEAVWGLDHADSFCGYDPDDHEWTSEGEGGCDDNPGVWSTGGTSMVFRTHCRRCGLRRTEQTTGSQRNPGEHGTVEYEMPDEDMVKSMIENGSMDER